MSVVVEGADNDRASPWEGNLDVAAEENAFLVAALEVVHFAGAARFDPCIEIGGGELVGKVFGRRDRRDACQFEAAGESLALQPLFEFGRPFRG